MALLDYYKERKYIPWKDVNGKQGTFPKGGVMDGNRVAIFSFDTEVTRGFESAYINIVVDSDRIRKLLPGEDVMGVMSKCLIGKDVEGYEWADWNYCVLLEFNPPLKEDPKEVLKSVVRSFSKKFGELLEKEK